MAVVNLTTQEFKDKIFNYDTATEWGYSGPLPAIIDFYADWCGPCKMVAPLLNELSEEYKDKIAIYKVDTDAEQELSAAFGIQSIPTFLFIPVEGNPMIQRGALPKSTFKNIINERLLKEPAQQEK